MAEVEEALEPQLEVGSAVDETEKSEEEKESSAAAAEETADDISALFHNDEESLILECIALAFKTNGDIKWKTTAEKDGVRMEVTANECFKSFIDDSNVSKGLQIVRGDTTVEDITPSIYHQWLEGYHDAHVVWEKEFEKTCTESKVIEYIDIDHTIAYTSYDPGYYVVSPRDFCYMKRRILLRNFDPFHTKSLSQCIENSDSVADDECSDDRSETMYDELAIYIYYDIEASHPNYVNGASKHIRANCIGGNIIAQKTIDSPVELLWVSRMDLRGWIPTWLVNMAVSSKVDSMGQLKENMKIVVNREKQKRADEIAARQQPTTLPLQPTEDLEENEDQDDQDEDQGVSSVAEEESQSQAQNKDSEIDIDTETEAVSSQPSEDVSEPVPTDVES